MLICDTEREDIGCLEVAVSALEAARRLPGLRVHLWASEKAHNAAWQPMFEQFAAIGALGEIHGREPDLDRVFRSMDVMASPHRIGTRTMLEALACGLQVVSDTECRYTRYQADPRNADRYAQVLVTALISRVPVDASPLVPCDLPAFGQRMTKIYKEVLSHGQLPADKFPSLAYRA